MKLFLTNRRMHINPCTVSMLLVSEQIKKHIHTLKYISNINITTHSMCMHYNNVMLTQRSLTLALEGQCNVGDLLPETEHQHL